MLGIKNNFLLSTTIQLHMKQNDFYAEMHFLVFICYFNNRLLCDTSNGKIYRLNNTVQYYIYFFENNNINK